MSWNRYVPIHWTSMLMTFELFIGHKWPICMEVNMKTRHVGFNGQRRC